MDSQQTLDPVSCTCGRVLVDGVDEVSVYVDGVAVPFRRETDHLVCPACLRSWPIQEIRTARGLA